MAKNASQPTSARRRSRKDYLLARKEQEQYRKVRLAVAAIGGLLLLILLVGVAYEYVVKPGQPVARVGETEISLGDWSDRVQLERAQTISTLDGLYEAVGGDTNQLAQFAGAQLQSLAFPSLLGESVLFQMVDEELIRQEADARGIEVSDAEVQAAIEEQFNYFDGGLPTPSPEPTETAIPTPSITPIVSEPITDTVEAETEEDAEPTEEPTPLPTATAVSQEAFDESFAEAIVEFEENGGGEDDFRAAVHNQLLRERLRDAMAGETELTTEQEQYSMFYISFQDEETANDVFGRIDSGEVDFITAWNEIRSAERVTTTQPFASELQWTSLQGLTTTFGTEVGDAVQTMEIGTSSEVLPANNDRFLLLDLRGRELRPLSESAINAERDQILRDWLEDQRLDATIFDRWEANVPTRPLADPKFFDTSAQPTPVIPQQGEDG